LIFAPRPTILPAADAVASEKCLLSAQRRFSQSSAATLRFSLEEIFDSLRAKRPYETAAEKSLHIY